MTHIGRRRFLRGGLALAGLGLLSGCGLLPPQAQQPSKIPRIGLLQVHPGLEPSPQNRAFLEGLRELGYVEGQTIAIEWRFSDGRAERFPELAAELVRLPVDVIVTADPAAISAAKQATSTIPIVMAVSGDPVGTGLIASLAQPGGNVTGLTNLAPELTGKRLQLLKEVVPGLSRVAALWNAANPAKSVEVRELQAAGGALGVRVRSLEVRSPDDFDPAFEAATRERPEALILIQDGLVVNIMPRIAEFATRMRLPTMGESPLFVEAGGLMSYGPSVLTIYRRAATYVDKILKGAKPGDLPVERPTRFEFIVNLRTARAIGLTIPESVLQQATEIIQ